MSQNKNLLQVSLMLVTYIADMRFCLFLLFLPLMADAGGIYTRDGVTDGDTFYLAPAALVNDDPAYQAWVAYSLMKSTCQLEIGGENPARASSFDCEHTARRHLIDAWDEKKQLNQEISDDYLDALSEVRYAGFLAEYVVANHGKRGWTLPEGLRSDEFRRWSREHLRGHKPMTRIIGSWNYKDKVLRPPG